MRLNYMSGEGQILTSVSVNRLTKKVKIVNYTEKITDRALGVKEDVTYQDVVVFFEKEDVPTEPVRSAGYPGCHGAEKNDPYLMCRKLQGRRISGAMPYINRN